MAPENTDHLAATPYAGITQVRFKGYLLSLVRRPCQPLAETTVIGLRPQKEMGNPTNLFLEKQGLFWIRDDRDNLRTSSQAITARQLPEGMRGIPSTLISTK